MSDNLLVIRKLKASVHHNGSLKRSKIEKGKALSVFKTFENV